MQYRKQVRAAILLAIAVVVQQLRLVVPLPLPMTTIIIGTVVNAVLALTVEYASLAWAVRMAFLLPCVAFIQGQLFMPLQIPVVFAANAAFAIFYSRWRNKWVVLTAPLVKTLVMLVGILFIAKAFGLEGRINSKLIMMMCWPQFVTGFLGLSLVKILVARLQAANNKKN